jgi:hypothetical protein
VSVHLAPERRDVVAPHAANCIGAVSRFWLFEKAG